MKPFENFESLVFRSRHDKSGEDVKSFTRIDGSCSINKPELFGLAPQLPFGG